MQSFGPSHQVHIDKTLSLSSRVYTDLVASSTWFLSWWLRLSGIEPINQTITALQYWMSPSDVTSNLCPPLLIR